MHRALVLDSDCCLIVTTAMCGSCKRLRAKTRTRFVLEQCHSSSWTFPVHFTPSVFPSPPKRQTCRCLCEHAVANSTDRPEQASRHLSNRGWRLVRDARRLRTTPRGNSQTISVRRFPRYVARAALCYIMIVIITVIAPSRTASATWADMARPRSRALLASLVYLVPSTVLFAAACVLFKPGSCASCCKFPHFETSFKKVAGNTYRGRAILLPVGDFGESFCFSD